MSMFSVCDMFIVTLFYDIYITVTKNVEYFK